MDKTYGFDFSIQGFTDYSRCFGEYDIVWTICGCFIFVGTIISYLPQDIAIIYARSNFGINPFMTFDTNLAQNLILCNILGLHASDFVGLFQKKSSDPVHKIKVLSTFLTVFNMVCDWYSYKFIFLLNFLFIDEEPREKRGVKKIRTEKIMARTFFGCSMIIEHLLMMTYMLIGTQKGFQSPSIRRFSQVASILSSIAIVFQYIPQMVTTCYLKDRGSYSIVSLAIMLVGQIINFAFLFFGQGEDWTTILPVGVTIVEQITLFFICIYFMVRKARLNKLAGNKSDNKRDDDKELYDSKYLSSSGSGSQSKPDSKSSDVATPSSGEKIEIESDEKESSSENEKKVTVNISSNSDESSNDKKEDAKNKKKKNSSDSNSSSESSNS